MPDTDEIVAALDSPAVHQAVAKIATDMKALGVIGLATEGLPGTHQHAAMVMIGSMLLSTGASHLGSADPTVAAAADRCAEAVRNILFPTETTNG